MFRIIRACCGKRDVRGREVRDCRILLERIILHKHLDVYRLAAVDLQEFIEGHGKTLIYRILAARSLQRVAFRIGDLAEILAPVDQRIRRRCLIAVKTFDPVVAEALEVQVSAVVCVGSERLAFIAVFYKDICRIGHIYADCRIARKSVCRGADDGVAVIRKNHVVFAGRIAAAGISSNSYLSFKVHIAGCAARNCTARRSGCGISGNRNSGECSRSLIFKIYRTSIYGFTVGNGTAGIHSS